MKIMTIKIPALLMLLLLAFHLLMSPVALANDASANVNVIAPSGDTSLNMLENRGIAARRGSYRRPTPREDGQSTSSDEKSNWKEYQKEKIKSKIERAIDKVTKKQDCLEKAQEYCQSNDIQNSIENCRQNFLSACQQKFRKYTPRNFQEETIKGQDSREDFKRLRGRYNSP